jgi:hypothetical protein
MQNLNKTNGLDIDIWEGARILYCDAIDVEWRGTGEHAKQKQSKNE